MRPLVFTKLLADTSQVASTSDAPPPKKKSKKNTTKDQHDPESSWDQSRAGKPILGQCRRRIYADLAHIDLSRFLSSQYPPSPSLVAAYASLKGVLAFPDADLISHASRLTDAILCALDTMHVFLFSSNSGPDLCIRTVPGALSQHIDSPRIAMTSPLLTYVLQTAIPALLRTIQGVNKRQRQHIATDLHVHIDRVLDHLLECVLLPLLRALVPLSFEHFAPLTVSPPKKPGRPPGKGRIKHKHKRSDTHPQKNPDTRTDAFTLIGMSLSALDALPSPGSVASSIAGGIRDRLGLETIRELEALYAPPMGARAQGPPTPPPSAPPASQGRAQQSVVTESRARRLERLAGTRAERVRALATRDAGWLLASTLGLCVTPAPVLTGGSAHCELVAGQSGGQLREALLDRVGKLVRSVHVGDSNGDSKLAIDPVCQNMLLAICERAMTQLAS